MMTKLMMAAVCLSVGAAAQAGDAGYSKFAPKGSNVKAAAGSVNYHRAAVVNGPSSRFAGTRSLASGSSEPTKVVQNETKITTSSTNTIKVATLNTTTTKSKGTVVTPVLYGTTTTTQIVKTPIVKTKDTSPVLIDLGTTPGSTTRTIIKAER